MKQLSNKTITGAPASYHSLLSRYCSTDEFDFIIEGGSRDCADAIKLNWSTNKKVFAFECNPSGLEICNHNLRVNDISNDQVEIITDALYHEDSKIDFYCTIDTPNPPCGPTDSNLIDVGGKRANIGTSSILPFTEKWQYVHTSKKVTVNAVKLDTFIEKHNLQNKKYILCMDLQGAEYYAIMGNQTYIKNCNLIILEYGTHQYKAPDECKIQSLSKILEQCGFRRMNEGQRGDAIYSRQ